jgi:hypothetical protein
MPVVKSFRAGSTRIDMSRWEGDSSTMHKDIKLQMKFILGILLLLIYSLSCSCALWASEDSPCAYLPIIPEDLLRLANKHGFSQVNDFYKGRHGMIPPAHVYGYLAGPPSKSVVFWCERPEIGEGRKFWLVIAKKADSGFTWEIIDAVPWDFFPGGLSIHTSGVRLKSFAYVEDLKSHPPETAYVKGNGILSSYDDLEALFYKYKGKWVVRTRH